MAGFLNKGNSLTATIDDVKYSGPFDKVLGTISNLLPQQEEANANMNRLLKEEQNQPFLKGSGYGTNPIPMGLLGGQVSDGNIMAAVPPHLQEQYGKFYGTNLFEKNAGLLGEMGVSPEQIAQAKTQQTALNPTDLAGRQQAAWKDAQDLIARGKATPEQMNKEFATLFGDEAMDRMRGILPTKKYEPKTQEEALEFEKKKKEAELGTIEEKERLKAAGKAKAKFEASYPKVKNSMSALNIQWNLVEDAINKAIAQTSGITAGYGSWLKSLPATDALTLSGYLDTIKANVGFDKLQQMREDSPTGGALGQVSDFENKMLQAVKGSLEQKLSPSQLKANLNIVLTNLKQLRKERTNAFQKDYSQFGVTVMPQPAATGTRQVRNKKTGEIVTIDAEGNIIGGQ